MKKNYQIRTNAKQFGEVFGVYDLTAPDTIYKDFVGDTFTDESGRVWTHDKNHHKSRYHSLGEGKFVKQTSGGHGTFSMEQEQARQLYKRLSATARNSWVRLYEIEG